LPSVWQLLTCVFCLQVYKGLDVATNKATKEETDGVPHHMMGTVDWGDECNVHEYREEALKIVSFCVYPLFLSLAGESDIKRSGFSALVSIRNLLFVFKQQVSNEVFLLYTQNIIFHSVCKSFMHLFFNMFITSIPQQLLYCAVYVSCRKSYFYFLFNYLTSQEYEKV